MTTLRCRNCNREFVRAHGNQIHCGNRCAVEYMYWLREQVEFRNCAVCGKRFVAKISSPRKYCTPGRCGGAPSADSLEIALPLLRKLRIAS